MAINTTEQRYDIDGDEMILPLTHAGLVSIEHVVTKKEGSLKKGAIVKAGHNATGTVGFALAAGDVGDTIPVCIRCNLVDFPGVGSDLVAGDRIVSPEFKNMIRQKKMSDWRIDRAVGIVHEDASANATRIKLVFVHD